MITCGNVGLEILHNLLCPCLDTRYHTAHHRATFLEGCNSICNIRREGELSHAAVLGAPTCG